MPNCRQCQSSFEIFPEDRRFYERLQVPEPTLCPSCRFQRRTAYRNERFLYKRECGLCHKSIVTIFSEEKPFQVYCAGCFWSDGWDSKAYGRDFDFSRPFFEQFKELRDEVPRLALLSKNSENCEYTNHASGNRNCTMTTILFGSEDVFYSRKILYSRSVGDSGYIFNHGERLYECFYGEDLYDSRYSVFCSNSSNLLFCYDCKGCRDCFMSGNLRNRQYVFYNQQLSKEEYQARLLQADLGSHSLTCRLLKDFEKLIRQAIKPAFRNENCENSFGDFLYHCKDCYECYYSNRGENCRYCVEFDPSADNKGSVHCMDSFGFGASELLYEVHAQANGYNNRFTSWSYDVAESQYLDMCFNVKHCFGCVGLHGQEKRCIFNRPYGDGDYDVLKAKIIDHMKKTGEYGEFFPVAMSPFGYHETVANEFFPLSREAVLARGWKWKEPEVKHYQPQTYPVPDHIREAKDDILLEVLACGACGKNYKLVRQELKFYRDLTIPIPRQCPDCRYHERMKFRNPQKRFQTTCPRCSKAMLTTYSDPQTLNVVCESCYLKEVY